MISSKLAICRLGPSDLVQRTSLYVSRRSSGRACISSNFEKITIFYFNLFPKRFFFAFAVVGVFFFDLDVAQGDQDDQD